MTTIKFYEATCVECNVPMVCEGSEGIKDLWKCPQCGKTHLIPNNLTDLIFPPHQVDYELWVEIGTWGDILCEIPGCAQPARAKITAETIDTRYTCAYHALECLSEHLE